jgi:hypothetical protein
MWINVSNRYDKERYITVHKRVNHYITQYRQKGAENDTYLRIIQTMDEIDVAKRDLTNFSGTHITFESIPNGLDRPVTNLKRY